MIPILKIEKKLYSKHIIKRIISRQIYSPLKTFIIVFIWKT